MADRIGQRYGDYRLIRLLGKGGFSDVYLGEQVHEKILAAVKVLYTRLIDKKEWKEFINEARTFRLNHPHIVKLLDFGIEDDGTPFLIMDYASNGTLRQRHPRGTVLTVSTVVSYTAPIASALQYAHTQRLIHRDIKPENMLVNSQNIIWLSDFGIAVAAHNPSSQTLQDKVGTVLYMAPEQIQGKPQPASDQYSLAVVVYEWLTGTLPFKGLDTEVALQHLVNQPPPLHTHIPTIVPAVNQVVLKALSKDPRQRFTSVQEFAEALEQASLPGQAAIPLDNSFNSPSPQPQSISAESTDKVPLPPTEKVPTPPLILDNLVPPKQIDAEVANAAFGAENIYTSAIPYLLFGSREMHWLRGDVRNIHVIRQIREAFTDFTFQVQLFKQGGLFKRFHMGLLFHVDDDTGRGYMFEMQMSREKVNYELSLVRLYYPLTGRPLSEPQRETSLATGSTRITTGPLLLGIVAQGDTFDFYANLHHLVRVKDNTVSSGKFAFYIPSDTVIGYEFIRVWTAEKRHDAKRKGKK